jgi:hypothetical protein
MFPIRMNLAVAPLRQDRLAITGTAHSIPHAEICKQLGQKSH